MDLAFKKNEDSIKHLVSELKKNLQSVYKGGGEKKVAAQHKKGKLTARERIQYLNDDEFVPVEIAAFAGDGMYEEYGGCPSGGVIVVIGQVSQRQCVIVANDATVKAGAWFPITAKKTFVHKK